MSSEVTSIEEKSNNSKNIITYSAILITFLIALWLSFQSEGPSKMPKVVTDEFTFTAWVNDGEDYLKKKLQMVYQNNSWIYKKWILFPRGLSD